MAQHFQVELKRSPIGSNEKQRRTLTGLGLKRFGKKVFLKDTPEVRGMLFKVVHLVDVTPIEGEAPESRNARRRKKAAS